MAEESFATTVKEACCLLDRITQRLNNDPMIEFEQRHILNTKVREVKDLLDEPRLLNPIACTTTAPDAPPRSLKVVGRNGERWEIPHKRPRDSLTPSPSFFDG